MKSIENIIEEQPINESLVYDEVIQKLTEAKENNVPVEEGLLGAVVGGTAGLIWGPKIMTTICNVLGIDVKGALGSLMTSRVIVTAAATKFIINNKNITKI